MVKIKFTVTDYGIKRAFILTPRAHRWLPISIEQAEVMLATNKAVLEEAKVGA